MDYTIYCDESRHTGGAGCDYAVIGGLWVQTPLKETINKEIKEIKKSNNINSELKWSKVSSSKIDGYKNLLNYFWENESIKYRAIIVNQKKADYNTFHNGDKELGFYKFYYEMLEKWLFSKCSYNILLDYKNNSNQARLPVLREVLTNFGEPRKIEIRNLTSIDSQQSNLAQLCDILTGAVSADANSIQSGSPKSNLIKHMSTLRKISPLSERSFSPEMEKFNIFRIALQG